MTYFEAMRILDQVREGVPHSEREITRALQLTGDIDE